MTERLAWVGPWNGNSAIATFGAFVVGELAARGHRVTVFRSELGSSLDLPPLRTAAEVQILPSHFTASSFDGVIVNIGNHFAYHGAALPLLSDTPCLVIFHDGYLVDLAAGWQDHHHHQRPEMMRRLTEAVYGASELQKDAPFWTSLADMARSRPMTEWVARTSAGIVTHAEFWSPRMREACPGKVTVQPLAFPDSELPPPGPIGARLIVATVGHANPNKCADAVLRAIGTDPALRHRCEYRLLGPIASDERDRLAAVAQSFDLPPPFCSGWIDDDALRAAIAEVDVIACLRNPVLEAGSASLITAMYSARPILVSRHGVYAEVPRDTVLPCKPGNECEDVARHLRRVVADPAGAQALGRRARDYALETFSAARYVDGLLPAVAAATVASPAIQAANRLGRILGEFGLESDDPAVERVAALLEETLGIQ